MVGPMIQRIKRQRGHCWSELGNVLAGRSTYVGGGSFVRGGTYVGGGDEETLVGKSFRRDVLFVPEGQPAGRLPRAKSTGR